MQVGDLVDDGLGNIGILVKSNKGTQTALCRFVDPKKLGLDGWYNWEDLEVLSESR